MFLKEKSGENLERIYEDNKKLEEGQALLTNILNENLPNSRVNLILIDLDGSQEVRQRGIEAKIKLVKQVQKLVKDMIPSNSYLIDVGTRDEMYVILPKENIETAYDLAETLRMAIANYEFILDEAKQETIYLTASIGLCSAPEFGTTSSDLMHAADEALVMAKKDRNIVHNLNNIVSDAISYHLTQEQEDMLNLMSEHLGRSKESLIYEAIKRLSNKHSALWYWGVEKWEVYATLKGAQNEVN
ncbi:GGDEF domain-containing protein [Bacillus sp. CH_442]|uniref:GGDEF domain-containing protein n=1 Tax=Bacillus sp. CH_442 TaxID=2978217 RepID=UPI0030F8A4DC|nr:diguanylate cyclase [Bacillus thuringiensis]